MLHDFRSAHLHSTERREAHGEVMTMLDFFGSLFVLVIVAHLAMMLGLIGRRSWVEGFKGVSDDIARALAFVLLGVAIVLCCWIASSIPLGE